MQIRFLVTLVLIIAITIPILMGGTVSEGQYTDDFKLEDCGVFLPNGENEYFSLQVGTFVQLKGNDDGEHIRVDIKALRDVYPIVFKVKGKWKLAICRVVEEKEWIDGVLFEISRNYFARCPNTNNIYYFGEHVDFFDEDGNITDHHGSWLAGQDGAIPGLQMPALVLAGSRYYQEVAPDIAEDRAEHVKTTATVHTPAGTFKRCLRVYESSPLEPGAISTKVYAPGVGLIQDDEILLTKYRKGETYKASSDKVYTTGVAVLLRFFGVRLN